MDNEETVHTFGWYLRQFVQETRAQGGTPILCSLTPRKGWSPGWQVPARRRARGMGRASGARSRRALRAALRHHRAKYEDLGRDKVDTLYMPSPKESLHTGWDGAVVNAECVIAGLKCPRATRSRRSIPNVPRRLHPGSDKNAHR